MNIFFLFAPKFLEWPLAIARELKNRIPEASFSGVASGPREIFNRIEDNKDPVIFPIDKLDELERKWISTYCDETRLDKYEAMLGIGTLKRIIISDRQIGNGFINGGLIPNTKLIKLSEDSEIVRRYVLNILDYIFEIFKNNRPDLVFLYAVAGAVSVAIAEACHYLNIPIARLVSVRIGNRYIIDTSFDGMFAPVRLIYEKALNSPEPIERVLPEAKKYLAAFREKPQQPDYAKFNRKLSAQSQSISGIARQTIIDLKGVAGAIVCKRNRVRSLRSTSEWDLTLHRILVGWKGSFLLRNGTFRSVGILPKRPFAYFPLHVDPEASTMVLSPMYTDQIAVIEALAKSLPLGMDLVVKEHVPMLGKRPAGFYKRLSRMPVVILASPFEDSLSLIKQAALTCVITGTAAWEAMLLQKPTLIIGNSPYMAIGQGFVYSPDLSSLPKAISEALNVPPADDDRLALYIAALLDQSFDFPTETFWGNVTKDVVQQNQKILNNICDRILALMEDRNVSGRSKEINLPI